MLAPSTRRTARLAIAALSVTVLAAPADASAAGTSTVAGAAAPCTATWDQRDVPEVGASDNVLLSITGTSSTSLYATGQWFPNAAGYYSGRILRNSGSGWADLALPDLHSDRVDLGSSVAPAPDEAWVGGSAYQPATVIFEPVLLHVVGNAVSRVALPPPPTGYAELDADRGLPVDSTGGSDLWAAASYYQSDYSGPHRTVLYRPAPGGGWTQTVIPIESVGALDAVSPSVAYIGGNGLFRWSAGSVTPVALPGNPAYVRGVTSTGPADVWVLAADTAGQQSLLHYDGATWSVVALPATGLAEATIDDMAVAPGGVLWVAGTWTDYALTHSEQRWVGRYHPGTRSWAAGPASPDAPTQASYGDAGGLSDLLALTGGDVYMAGWGDGQYESVIGRLCQLTVGTAGPTPSAVSVKALGDVVLVTAGGATSGDVRANDSTGLLSAGPLQPGQGAALHPEAAGTYRLVVQPGSASATVGVPVRPLNGPRQAVTVYVATRPAPTGYAYRLQVAAPGGAWQTVGLSSSTGGMAKIFYPTKWARGTYSARAKVVNTTTGVATGWSPPVSFTLPAGG